ncbi:restriction endonuclease subunit S [Leuconostoc mesenteroides]|uniref:restriction endonuclease subunit S n=1 Tax=Leuconostoc mesenteroides TaxID=1245 RepID=UPI00123ADBEA|nr:restriction endonuclease subunit S [Leuconostoc mesenteroides]
MGDLANIVRGASPRPIQDPKWFDKESNIGWLRISDVTEQNGRIYHLDQHISKLGQEKTRVLTEPHLLLSIAATVGKPLVNYIKTGVHDGFLIFLDPLFEREFMFQWLEMFRPQWKKYGQPGSQVNLNSELIRNQDILIPGNTEQQKIGSFFKQLDNLITQNERKIDLLKQLKQAYLQKIFSQELRFAGFSDAWKECELGEVFVTVTDYVANGSFESLRNNVKSYTTENYAYMIRLQDASNDWKGPWLYTDQAGYLFLSKSKLYSNDIIMSNVGSVGKFFLVPDLDKPMTLAPNAVLIKSSTSNNLFLYQMMIGETMQSKINKKATPGVQSKINKTDFKKITTKIPQKKEQQKIGTLFKQLDNLIALHQQKLNLLKKQKQAFLQKMFI